MHRGWVLAAGLLILVVVNAAIVSKERHLASGRLVYLELAPVDPRSLMQGDYMALRFTLGNRIRRALPANESDRPAYNGYVVVRLDEAGVARFVRLETTGKALAPDEIRLRYRFRDDRVKFATNAFFFREGTGDSYEDADYGGFRVNEYGEPLLVSLHDAELERLGETNRALWD